jgi:DNA-binding transcriptional LysR family regulator
MHLKSLRVFCDVVRRRSFSRAADENGISQSAASQMVNHLEQHLGVKLIDRSKRPFVLTSEGSAFYEGCRGIVRRYFELEEKVKSLRQEVAGRVRVASIYSIGLHHMNEYLQRFLTLYPKANVRLEYLHPNRVYQSVERDIADLGLVSYPRPSRSIDAIPWRKERMVLVCAPHHELARSEVVDWQDLEGLRIVSFDKELTIRKEIDRVLNAHEVLVDVVSEFDNIETIKRAIEVDMGVALLPEPTVVHEVAAGTLAAVRLATDELVRPIGIIYRRGRELSTTAQRFVDLLRGETNQPPERSKRIERTPAVAVAGG